MALQRTLALIYISYVKHFVWKEDKRPFHSCPVIDLYCCCCYSLFRKKVLATWDNCKAGKRCLVRGAWQKVPGERCLAKGAQQEVPTVAGESKHSCNSNIGPYLLTSDDVHRNWTSDTDSAGVPQTMYLTSKR